MTWPVLCPAPKTLPSRELKMTSTRTLRTLAPLAAAALLAAASAHAQITVNTKTGAVTNESTGTTTGTVDRRYQQITPTHVDLPKTELDAKTRLELIRLLQSEQGFAMRPMPRGHKGLTLEANGNLVPAGEAYLDMVTTEGMSAKPGDRVVLSDIKFDRNKIVIDLNGGPDPAHRFLRHIQLGAGGTTNPIMQGDDQQPVGSRISLAFKEHVPALTDKDVKALLSPLISFDVKTPVQAYTDTLPKKLKDAILEHHVLVGMSTDMVLFCLGQPDGKSREMDGQMPFEEWIYGKPPKDVQFVRINGNRVIRVEVAKMGETPIIFDKDEVEGLMRTDGTPLDPVQTARTTKEGDVQRDPNTQAPAAPPSLRNPGEKLPTDSDARVGAMKPVQFPKPRPDPPTDVPPGAQPGANPDGEQPAATDTTQSTGTSPATPPASPPPAPAQPKNWVGSFGVN